jgi:hypothetical protein
LVAENKHGNGCDAADVSKYDVQFYTSLFLKSGCIAAPTAEFFRGTSG